MAVAEKAFFKLTYVNTIEMRENNEHFQHIYGERFPNQITRRSKGDSFYLRRNHK